MKYILSSLLLLFVCLLAQAQSKFAVNQPVEVNWKGKWYKATILKTEGRNYKIHYDGYSASYDEIVPANRIRVTGKTPASKNTFNAGIQYGKYGCTASKYSNGSYTYLPKGSFTLNKNGSYTYHGFEKPITGNFKVESSGIITFTSGYFKDGQATPMEDRPNRYYLVFPTIPDGRWTCSLLE